MGDGRGTLTHEDWPNITSKMEAAVKEAQQFHRVEISKEEALEMFQENRFKVSFSAVSLLSGASRGCQRCPEECAAAQWRRRNLRRVALPAGVPYRTLLHVSRGYMCSLACTASAAGVPCPPSTAAAQY